MKLFLKLLASFVVALVLGVGSALLLLRGGLGGTIAVGPWMTSDVIGSADADPYTRARVAIGGLLALNRSETIYFTAATDSDGEALRMQCTYKIIGSDPPARWWSITAYAADHYLIPNPQDRYSYGGNTVAREDDGSFVISAGPSARRRQLDTDRRDRRDVHADTSTLQSDRGSGARSVRDRAAAHRQGGVRTMKTWPMWIA